MKNASKTIRADARARGIASRLREPRLVAAAAFVAAHVVLALLVRAVPGVATVHAVLVLAVGLMIAISTRRLQNVAAVVAYIAGAEVFWRMTKAGVFWEFGKYSMIAVMLVAIARLKVRRNAALALTYIGLLLPSIALTFTALDVVMAREEVSFNLAGPLAIACAVIFFSSVQLTVNELRATFVAAIGPIIAVSTMVFVKTGDLASVVFGNGSNSSTSGGFGPNQVSAVLGLGLMLLMLLSLDRRLKLWVRLALLGPAAVLAFQTILTFARGGILFALAGIFAAMFVLVRANRNARIGVVLIALFSYAIGTYVIEPRLEQDTNGQLSVRYANTQSSGRDQIIDAELGFFRDNIALGVGPGVGMQLRMESGEIGPSHTEYSRMLAEHGLLGLVSLVCLLIIYARAVLGARSVGSRAVAAALVTWTALFLAVYATRIAAPAFAIGLAFALPKPPAPRRTLGDPRPSGI